MSPFLIQGQIPLAGKGLVMLAIHSVTVLCVSQLQETKGTHMGRISTFHDDEVVDEPVTRDEQDNELDDGNLIT